MTSSLDFKPFDEADFNAFAGAEQFAPGIMPLICNHSTSAIYIVDRVGRSAFFFDDSGDDLVQFSFITDDNQCEWPENIHEARAARWTELPC